MKVAIIGGGISGLSAAYYLSKSNHDYRVYETNLCGGVIQSKQLQGFTLELGPNVLVLKPELLELIKDLNLSDQIVSPAISKYEQFIYSSGSVQKVPKSLSQFINTNLMSSAEKFQILRNIIFRKLKLSNPIESVADFMSQVLPGSLPSTLLDPVLRGIYGGDIKQLNAKLIFPKLWDAAANNLTLMQYLRLNRQAKNIAVLRFGNHQLIEGLLKKLNPKSILSSKVTNVDFKNNKYFVSSSNTTEEFDRVLVSTSGSATGQILSSLVDCSFFSGLKYAPLVVCHVVCNQLPEKYSKAFGILFPNSYESPVMGIMFNSNLFPHVAPDKKSLATICLGGVLSADVINLSEADIFAKVNQELKTIGIESKELLNCQRWQSAIPQYTLEHQNYLEKLAKIESKFPGLHFIGADRGGVGVADRVAVAKKATVF